MNYLTGYNCVLTKDAKKLAFALFLSSGMLMFWLLMAGTFFEEYEILFNFICEKITADTSVLDVPFLSNEFLLFQLYIFIKKYFGHIPVSVMAKLILIFFSMTVIVFNVVKSALLIADKAFLLILLFLLFGENIVLLSSTRASLMFMAAAFSILLFYFQVFSKKHKTIFIFLFIIGLLFRLEVGLIFSLLSIIGAFLFRTNHRWFFGGVFFLSLVSFISLFILNNKDHRYSNFYVTNESKIFYSKNIDLPFEQLFSGKEITDIKTLQVFASAFFILDEPVKKYNDIQKYYKHDYRFDSLLNLKQVFLNNIKDAYINIACHKIFLAILVLLILALITSNYKNWKQTGFLLILLFFPFFISIFQHTPSRFSYPFYSMLLFLLAVLLLIKKGETKRFWLKSIFLILIALDTTFAISNVVESKNKEVAKTEIINEFITPGIDNKVFVLSVFSFDVLNPAVFKQSQYEYEFVVNWIFDYSPLFRNSKREIYGNNYASLKGRFDYLVDNSVDVLGSKRVLDFFKDYLREVHQVKIKYTVVKEFKEFPNEDKQLMIFNIKYE